jgi:hypothetical protein
MKYIQNFWDIDFSKTSTWENVAFRDNAPCKLIEASRRFKGAYYLSHPITEAVNSSETSPNFYKTTWRNYPRRLSSSYSPPCEPEILVHPLGRPTELKAALRMWLSEVPYTTWTGDRAGWRAFSLALLILPSIRPGSRLSFRCVRDNVTSREKGAVFHNSPRGLINTDPRSTNLKHFKKVNPMFQHNSALFSSPLIPCIPLYHVNCCASKCCWRKKWKRLWP